MELYCNRGIDEGKVLCYIAIKSGMDIKVIAIGEINDIAIGDSRGGSFMLCGGYVGCNCDGSISIGKGIGGR